MSHYLRLSLPFFSSLLNVFPWCLLRVCYLHFISPALYCVLLFGAKKPYSLRQKKACSPWHRSEPPQGGAPHYLRRTAVGKQIYFCKFRRSPQNRFWTWVHQLSSQHLKCYSNMSKPLDVFTRCWIKVATERESAETSFLGESMPPHFFIASLSRVHTSLMASQALSHF